MAGLAILSPGEIALQAGVRVQCGGEAPLYFFVCECICFSPMRKIGASAKHRDFAEEGRK